MSKRAGEFITVGDLLREVNKDHHKIYDVKQKQ